MDRLSSMDSDFAKPDFRRPVDVGAQVELVPAGATIKGMFLSSLLEALGPRRVELPEGQHRYVAFKDYPLAIQVRLIVEVAGRLHPDVPIREAIRRVGHRVYPTFSESLVGKVLFSAVGGNPVALLRAGAKAYGMSASVGSVEIVESTEGSACIRLRDMFNFIDCYQIGIIEGALLVLGLNPSLRVKLDSPTSGWFDVRW